MQGLPPIGLVGLGNMGGAIAERLLACGAVLHIHDPSPTASAVAAEAGAIAHASPRAVADHATIVAGCVPTVSVARSIAIGDEGLIAGRSITTYLEFSTVGPDAAEEMADLFGAGGIGYVDAAVSGGRGPALRGELSVMLAGAPASRAVVLPVIEAIAANIFVIGDVAGQAQTMKLINNILCAANIATSFEALTMGTRFGLDPATMIEVIQASSGRSTGLNEPRASAILSRRFDSGPRIGVLQKDIGLALDLARARGFPLHATPALLGVAELWNRAAATGMGGADIAELITLVEEAAGQGVRAKAL